MKIKRTRQVTLDELLPLVWSNKFDYLVFESDNNGIIRFDMNGKIRQANGIKYDDLFTITEEVEITEDTLLDVILVYDEFSGNKNHVGRVFRVSVNQITKINTDGNIKFIYLQNEDGSIGEIVWSKERGFNATNTEI